MKKQGVEYWLLLFYLMLFTSADARQLASTNTNTNGDDVTLLLEFKKNSVNSDPNGFLDNWTVDSLTPCSWRGVNCSVNGQTTTLDLIDFGLVGTLHLSNLTALTTLEVLSLQGNLFSSGDLSVPKNSPCYLKSVDLSSNNLSEPLSEYSFLQSCDRLTFVNLSRNYIPGGTIHVTPSLLQLDLSRNRISDSAILSYALANCQNLNLLNMSDNKMAGKLNHTPSACRSLSAIDLSYNLFVGELPPTFVADSPATLEYLDLSHNNFSSPFSSLDFGNCSQLSFINLSTNSFSGSQFPTKLSNCKLLETIDFSHNLLGDKNDIPGALLGNFKKLKHLSLAHNQFSGNIPPQLGQTCGTLEFLDLSMNKLIGELPSIFLSCSSLKSLNLGSNQLSGDFLTTVVSKLQDLMFIYVPFNNITGLVPLSLTNCSQLRELDLSSNGFTGNIPSGFCSNFGFLESVFLAGNYLSGSVPSELGNCRNLKRIDLSFNDLKGEIPSSYWTLPNLSDLVIWANSLTGEIPEGICVKGGNLETLILNNNFLTGSIPKSIANCTNMIWVSLANNRLTGEIPAGIGNLENLAILQLGNNSLGGDMPPELGKCRSLIWLDLNSNNLSGPLPHELTDQSGLVVPGSVSGKQFAFVRNEGGTSCRGAGGLVEFQGIRPERLENFPMVHSCPSTRIYSGLTVYTFTSNGSMIYLDLSYNLLSGTILESFGTMSYLQVLNLGHNELTGNIPSSFGDLKMIGVLDLSHNQLQGYIPGSLGGLSFLSDLDVSNNNLSGVIPSGGQLTTFPAARYENNSGLCGVPLPACGSGRNPEKYHHAGKNRPVETGVVVGITFFLVCILGLILALYQVKKNQVKDEQREKYIESLPTSGSSSWKLSGVPEPLSINIATFEKPLRKLTFAHLLEATNGFSADSLIGTGGFGEVYKAQLKDGCVVAIKKLVHIGQGDREFIAEMETIGKIKHRNLVPLLGYCKIGEERLLVYEYMKWGSLESVLHDRIKGGWAKQLLRENRSSEILDSNLLTDNKSGDAELFYYLKIAFACLDDRPFRRPTMIQVMAMFKDLQVESESDILDGLLLIEET
ncbi:hypothetical protein ACFE04_022069 [Oxalis oulophora]